MASAGIAARMADELGATYDDAARWVDELGGSRAAQVSDEAAQGGSSTVGDWWKPAAAVGGIGGGGALLWRQQDVQKARSLADSQQDYSSAIQSIMEDDSLSSEQKQKFVDQLTSNLPSGEDSDDGGGGPLDRLTEMFDLGGAQTTLILVIVVAIVLTQTLDGGGD